jgi:two-component system KDP operon response regulator KdpE
MTQTQTRRVLLVEDNDLNRTLARAVLARSHEPVARACTLVEAFDLAAARAALAAGPMDLILLDLQLPDGNGLTLAEELATRPKADRPVIVALTAAALPEQQDAALTAGCDDFLAKPYRPHQLIDVLVTHLSDAGLG